MELKFRLVTYRNFDLGQVNIEGYVMLDKPNAIIAPAYTWDRADIYIGQKDVNGTEIYLNDIVEIEDPDVDDLKIVCKVLFHSGGFFFEDIVSEPTRGFLSGMFEAEDILIVEKE